MDLSNSGGDGQFAAKRLSRVLGQKLAAQLEYQVESSQVKSSQVKSKCPMC